MPLELEGGSVAGSGALVGCMLSEPMPSPLERESSSVASSSELMGCWLIEPTPPQLEREGCLVAALLPSQLVLGRWLPAIAEGLLAEPSASLPGVERLPSRLLTHPPRWA